MGVRYALAGGVRKATNRLRVTAQLIDATDGTHIWADRFEGALEDVFDLQDQITERVVTAVAPQLERAEVARSRRKPTGSRDVYDYYLRGLAFVGSTTKDDVDRALQLFLRAVELDPEYASAYGMATWCHIRHKARGWYIHTAEKGTEALQLAHAAARFGHDAAVALSHAAFAIAYLSHDLELGNALVDQALAVNPNLALAWTNSGWIKLWLGEPAVAVEHLGHAMRLNPIDNVGSMMKQGMAHSCLFLGKHTEALSWANKLLHDQPDALTALCIAIASATFAGADEVAQSLRVRLQSLHPEFRVSWLESVINAPFQRPDQAKYEEGLRKAGLPK